MRVPAMWIVAGGMLAVVAIGLGQAPAQAPPQQPVGKAGVLGTGSFTSFVENMDRSLAFYHDAFGMDVPALPATGQRPYNQANPQLFAMFDIQGARERHQSARLPGTRVSIELMDIQEVPHQTVKLRPQDPGNATLVLMVRDVDAALAGAVRAKAAVETPGGKAVTLGNGTRAILIRDLDGRLIELRQTLASNGAATETAAAGNIGDMRLSIAVNDLAETTRVYREVFGFKVERETPFTADAFQRALTGLPKADVRRATAQAPGSNLVIEFVEYRGLDRTPLRMRIQDRGAARLQVRVQDAEAAVAAVKGAGMKVMSEGGVAQPIPPNFKGALVADPNNFFLTPYAPCDACAPTIAPLRDTKK